MNIPYADFFILMHKTPLNSYWIFDFPHIPQDIKFLNSD